MKKIKFGFKLCIFALISFIVCMSCLYVYAYFSPSINIKTSNSIQIFDNEENGLGGIKVTLKDVADSENSESHHTELENYESTTVKYTNDDVTVINTTGSLLPSTGGMGTVLFITVGSIMVLGFGVLLVTKLRLSKMDI